MTQWTADKIKELREEYGESQPQFATRFRLGVDTIRKWEGGKSAPNGAATVILDTLAESIASHSGRVNGKTNGHHRKR